MTELGCEEVARRAAKIIYGVHDQVKDKEFILEMGWCCEASGGVFEELPKPALEDAEAFAKKSMEEDEDAEMTWSIPFFSSFLHDLLFFLLLHSFLPFIEEFFLLGQSLGRMDELEWFFCPFEMKKRTKTEKKTKKTSHVCLWKRLDL